MATQTTHYNLIKPASADRVAVGDINDNSDIIDGYLFQANERADQIADDYNTSSTYNTDDYVRRENYLYKCKEDGVTGNWDVSKWDRVKVMDEINQGGGGSSTLAGLSDVALSSPSNGQLSVHIGVSAKVIVGLLLWFDEDSGAAMPTRSLPLPTIAAMSTHVFVGIRMLNW